MEKGAKIQRERAKHETCAAAETRGGGRRANMADVVDLTLSSDESDSEIAVVVPPPAKKAKVSVKAEGSGWQCQVQ